MYSQNAEREIIKMIVGAVADNEQDHLGTYVQMVCDAFEDWRRFHAQLGEALLERGYICVSSYKLEGVSTVAEIASAFVKDDNEAIADLDIGLYNPETQRKIGRRKEVARIWQRLRDGDVVLVYENDSVLGPRVIAKEPAKVLREYEFLQEGKRASLPGLAAYNKRLEDARKEAERKRQEELAARHYNYTWVEVNELGLSEFRKDSYRRVGADRFAGYAARDVLESSVWGYTFPDGKFVPTSELLK